jgi:hypothetical protein
MLHNAVLRKAAERKRQSVRGLLIFRQFKLYLFTKDDIDKRGSRYDNHD